MVVEVVEINDLEVSLDLYIFLLPMLFFVGGGNWQQSGGGGGGHQKQRRGPK